MLKNSCIMQAWQHLTLHLLYSEGLDGAMRLIARIPSLFIPQFISSAVNLIVGIEIQNMTEWLRGAQISLFE